MILHFDPPDDGALPNRPAALQRPTFNLDLEDDPHDVPDGAVIVLGGVSLIGADGYIVPVISVIQTFPDHIRGWLLTIGHPDREGLFFEHFDTSVAPLTVMPIPEVMIYFTGQYTDPTIGNDAASLDDLLAIAKFVRVFISDEGPPKGIDWHE